MQSGASVIPDRKGVVLEYLASFSRKRFCEGVLVGMFPLKRIPETRFQSQNCSLVLASAGTREFFGWNSSSRSIKTLTVVMIRSKNQVFFEVGNVKKKTVRSVMCRGLSIITLSC